MRTMAAKLGTDAGRYTHSVDVVAGVAHDATTARGAALILADPRDKKAARRVMAELWVARGIGLPWEALKAPGRVLIALRTLGYVTQELTADKVRMLSLTAWGRQQALKAIEAKA
jgi:hypothetical protein